MTGIEKEKVINGIDVSECPCKDDDKCLEVPILNEYGDLIDYQDCELQTLCPYRLKTKIQRLQEENEDLKKKKDEYYLINLDYETKISYLIQALEEINILAKNYCNACDEFKAKTYKALEEIRKEANRLLYEENPIYGYNNSNYFELLAKYVLAKTKEVLDDRN